MSETQLIRSIRSAPKARTMRVATVFADGSVTLPLRLVSEANAHGHWVWRYRRSKGERGAVKGALANVRRPALPCTVTLTRIAPRKLDGDNLQRAFKATRDQVAEWLGVDDGGDLVTWQYAQERSIKPRTYGVRIAWSSP